MQRLGKTRLDTLIGAARTQSFLSFAKPASYFPDVVGGAAQFCLERRSVDGIIYTGDLATTGMMSDLLVARSFVMDDATDGYETERGTPTLAAARRPVYVIPGNHDKYRDVAATPNCANFAFQFGGLMRNYKNGVGYWVRRKQGRYIGFLYADFCLQSRSDATDKAYAVYGQGRVTADALDELVDRTFYLKEVYPNIKLVWVIHFAPFDCGYSLQLNDYANFTDAAIAAGVMATLCGHTHLATRTDVKGHVVLCAGSTGCVDSEDDSRIQVLHFDIDDEESSVSRDNFLWSNVLQEFQHHSTD